MKIHVRRRHIGRAKRGDSRECPIALACTEAMGGIVRIGYSRAWIDGKSCRLSSAATRFISRFDAGKPVKPFAFVLK